MTKTQEAFAVGAADGELVLQLGSMGNRHGLITGATGTGKTVSLQVLAEAYSRQGVPVFAADIKGDLSGINAPGKPHKKIDERLGKIPLPEYNQRGFPTLFWDVFGKKGHPIRATTSDIGPLLLSSLLELNDTQTGVLYAAFALADDEGLLLLDLKDLRALLSHMGENAKALRLQYGNISSASIAAIQRRLLVLEEQGGEAFLGEPAVALDDLMRRDDDGRGVISILDATRLTQQSPRVYATFLLWLLSEVYETLPEVGDPTWPTFVMFFDEAHLLFKRAPEPLLDKIEQVARLIRSKGVGIYFISQSPLDLPDNVLGQMGLKVQHALRAYTPKDRRTIRAVADSFRTNPDIDTAAVLTELGTGEALVSALDRKGAPLPVQRTLIRPPESRIGPLKVAERKAALQDSLVAGVYDKAVDRDSAYELLRARAEQAAESAAAKLAAKKTKKKSSRSSSRQTPGEAMLKSTLRSMGTSLGRALIRGLLGSFRR
ncbi:MAG: helicase HerA-like domain-containing protein [Pseudomonadota bacterium]